MHLAFTLWRERQLIERVAWQAVRICIEAINNEKPIHFCSRIGGRLHAFHGSACVNYC